MDIVLQEPYQPRPIRSLGVWTVEGWRLKMYTISYRAEAVRPALVERAKTLLVPHLPAHSPATCGVGFIGVHQGRGGDFVFIGWWGSENELSYHVYIAPADDPEAWAYCNATGPLACVWDLALVGHERGAWVETVLANPAGPDVEAYLARQLNADV